MFSQTFKEFKHLRNNNNNDNSNIKRVFSIMIIQTNSRVFDLV